MTEDEIRAALIAQAREVAEQFQIGPLGTYDKSAVLDNARRRVEEIVGQPCIAQYEGRRIVVQTPVLRIPKTYGD